MKQESLDQLKELRRFVEASRQWWTRYRDVIREPSCDKHEAQFNSDDRFVVFALKRLQFTALTGYFGSSGCGTFSGGLSESLAARYLPQAMTALAPQLFEKMAELAEADAVKLNTEAQKELDDLQALVADAAIGGTPTQTP